MAAVRRNIVDSPVDAQRFVEGVQALKAQPLGVRASEIGIAAGPLAADADLSWWDGFVIWHSRAMGEMSPDGARNAAHSGPVFLPWHRWFMIVLEVYMQQLLGLGRDDFGLPYWDWAADGDLAPAARRNAPVWGILGGDGTGPRGEVEAGPFSAAAGFVVTVDQGPSGAPAVTNRPLRRSLGQVFAGLPATADTDVLMNFGDYDAEPYSQESTGFRNSVEGWAGLAAHNHVHMYVGGDMLMSTSPNDPAFYLNHCNVDRLWSQWRGIDPTRRTYVPVGQSAPGDALYRHRALDPIYSLLTQSQPQVISMQDASAFYTYG